MPDTGDLAEPFADAHLAKAALEVQGAARVVRHDDLRLQGPVAVGLGRRDKASEQGRACPSALC